MRLFLLSTLPIEILRIGGKITYTFLVKRKAHS